ncbi:MAG: hypothetical protein KA163_00520 [Bacteroidia bacterium]|nr:hypothetical protein [Bacteroidia bacterium]
MEQLLKILVIIHICAGAGVLIFGAIAFGLRKNTPKHKPIGKIYFWCMSIVFVTAMIVSVAKSLLFLFMIGIFSYYSTIIAYRSLRLKNLHNNQKPLKLDWFIEILSGLTFLGMVVLGLFILIRNQNVGGVVPLIFGCFGLLSVRTNLKLFIKGPKETLYWYKKHIGHMMGSYIGAFTAFLVNQTPHIPIHPTLLWFLPTLIIMPAMIIEMKKVKSKPIDA